MTAQTFWLWLADGPNWKPIKEFTVLDDALKFARTLAKESRVAVDTNREWLFLPKDDPAFKGASSIG